MMHWETNGLRWIDAVRIERIDYSLHVGAFNSPLREILFCIAPEKGNADDDCPRPSVR